MVDKAKKESVRLLIVDDNVDMGSFLRRFMELSAGWQVTLAVTLEEARIMFSRDQPQVVLIDVFFDEAEGRKYGPWGIELASWLKSVSPETVIVFMSGSADGPELVEQAFEGACFLAKPFTPTDLMKQVAPLIARSSKPSGAIEIFVSYSHRDEKLREELEKHLAVLKRQGVVRAWHDRLITPGGDFLRVIDQEMERSDLIILLISPDFLSSDFCYGREMERALERHQSGEAVLIPVILRPVHWQEAPFGRIVALPKDGKPVTSWANRDAAFFDVVQGLRQAIDQIKLSRATQ
jgi:DNA-binding response OmpR family regulator